jgi:hypothetical protein
MKLYTVYRITNQLNNKTYVGVHYTNDPNDSYYGSGIAIKNAIKKHGRENFKKEILKITDSKKEAYKLEFELTEDYSSSDTYNMKRGGVGGFTRENAFKGALVSNRVLISGLGGRAARDQKKGVHSLNSEQHKINGSKGGKANKGKPKSEEHRQKLRDKWIIKKLLNNSFNHSYIIK